MTARQDGDVGADVGLGNIKTRGQQRQGARVGGSYNWCVTREDTPLYRTNTRICIYYHYYAMFEYVSSTIQLKQLLVQI